MINFGTNNTNNKKARSSQPQMNLSKIDALTMIMNFADIKFPAYQKRKLDRSEGALCMKDKAFFIETSFSENVVPV